MSFTKVATLCEAGEVYLAQHMGEQGRWVSSTDKKSCMTDKLEILEYCKKVILWKVDSYVTQSVEIYICDFWMELITVKNTV